MRKSRIITNVKLIKVCAFKDYNWNNVKIKYKSQNRLFEEAMEFFRVECTWRNLKKVYRPSTVHIANNRGRARIKSGRHAYSGIITVLTGPINLHKFYVRCAKSARARSFRKRVAKSLIFSGSAWKIRAMINRRYCDEGSIFLFSAARKVWTHRSCVPYTSLITMSDRSCANGRNAAAVQRLTKIFMERYIEHLNYSQDRRRNIGSNVFQRESRLRVVVLTRVY